MEKFIQNAQAPTQSDEVEINPEKLKFFDSKLKVWDFAKISASEFQNLPFDSRKQFPN